MGKVDIPYNTRMTIGRGFTIVELLIVIVVIAILAAISIVAYNGIQDRARNSATIQAAQQVQKLANSYVINTGQVLTTASNVCLTQENICASDSGATPTGTNNSGLMATLQPYGSLPNSVPYPAGIRTSNGVNRMVNDKLNPLFLIFWIKGTNANCGMSVVSGSASAWYTSATGYSGSSGGWTQCVAPIQAPSNS